MRQRKYYLKTILLVFCLTNLISISVRADNNSRLYRPVDNWDVDGSHGTIYVTGSLTQSPCRLSMTSAYQSVDMGNIETAYFPSVGVKGKKIPFQIELQDCLEMHSNLENVQSGQVAWSNTQPAVKIRFLAKTVPFMPNIISVNGVSGLGIELSSADGNVIAPDQESNPLLLSSGQNVLTYYIAPVRVAKDFNPGNYYSLISFEMTYE